MGAALLVTLREGLEAALIVGIILAYLARTGHRAKFGLVWTGTGLAVGVSLLAGAAIFLTAGQLEGRVEEIFEGTAMFTAAGVLTYMVFWMRRQAINIRAHLQAQVSTALARGSSTALVLLAFVAVGREGIETALFMFAAAQSATALQTVAGGVLGLGTAVLLGYLLYRGTYRLNLRAFFNITSVLLLLFGAGLLAHGIHEYQEAGLLPVMVEQVWDTSRILSEKSVAGSLLGAVFGYNANPSLLEVLAYGLYLLGVGWAYFRPPTARELAAHHARA
ncbi:MAG: iron uptake transporter permease EfeU [Armatimonadota bacterium]|nr:iron uptake transporter permease EfeU [Armatimonadota bacterium]MDR7436082.1 iron uptake transporter permease EfeU [Armatimonadota bacterium]MDR7471961.1 iron uptake transporter permease EfeU [Armatimonadota bacterium]MDR7507031.1 iron uptake transporter permease EfeU [Armatimonadota bacterium]MDR7508617.1 iron uptake transporter permease EfeU [Armatimonadota bacterium]